MNSPISHSQMAESKNRCTETLLLSFRGVTFRVLADSAEVLTLVASYYAGLADAYSSSPCLDIYLSNQSLDTNAAEWAPVKRAKSSPLGLKEAYIDTETGRWIHKVRTGMVMFQSLTEPTVFGDLEGNLPQVVNFINNQFLNHYQRRGYLLGHAAAYSVDGKVIAIAASSGGGKSTLMLRALEVEGTRFLSNDRILFRPKLVGDATRVHVLGLAKHPRVNPGTLINSDRLSSIMPAEERVEFEKLSREELWDIEQKYDVLIPNVYGDGKSDLDGVLEHLILLDWSLASSEPTALNPIDIDQNPQALDGLRKSPGPFYQDSEGQFPAEGTESAEVYRQNLQGVKVWRLSGAVDFDRAIEQLREQGLVS